MAGVAPGLSALEQRQQANRAANRKVLQQLGLLEPLPPLPSAFRVQKRPAAPRPRPAKKPRPEQDPAELGSELREGKRRSTRSTNKPEHFDSLKFDSDYEPASGDESDDYGGKKKRKLYTPRIKVTIPKNREKVYGVIEGVPVGTWWATRMECCADGIHRPTVAGIHAGPDGAYSIALSGGYEDDLDWGECFTYTGEGGRDLKGTSASPKNLRTAPQSKDQELTRGNLALSRNVETRTPVRVIRGYKLQSPYAPEEGYRYDGLYWVEKYWLCAGLSGFKVFKFVMNRCEDQAPPPWETGKEGEEKENKPNLDNAGDGEEEAVESDDEMDGKDGEKEKAVKDGENGAGDGEKVGD